MPLLPHDPRPSFLDSKIAAGGLIDPVADYVYGLPQAEAAAIRTSWVMTARRSQMPVGSAWDVWVMLAGRGFGKTRAGAEWVCQRVGDPRHRGPKNELRIALVAASLHEARNVMVEGESGILSLYADRPHLCPKWEPSLRQLTWKNGARAFVYSAAEPDSLRGPQHHFAWCDEIAKWGQGELAWMNLRMGLRLGLAPRILATTTPRYCELVTNLVHSADENAKIVVSRGRMDDNVTRLPPSARAALRQDYGGTRLGRQELDGELLDGAETSLWTRAGLAAARDRYDPLAVRRKVVIAVDPATTAGGDACGIIVAALLDPLEVAEAVVVDVQAQRQVEPQVEPQVERDALNKAGADTVADCDAVADTDATGQGITNPPSANPQPANPLTPTLPAATLPAATLPAATLPASGPPPVTEKPLPRAVILADETVSGCAPNGWALRVADAFRRWGADLVVAECNQGGSMVREVLHNAQANLPVELVYGHHSKVARADPVSVWYDKGRVAHAAHFPELEAQLCGLTATEGYVGPGRSPDRADALVYALTALLGEDKTPPPPRVLSLG